MSNLRIEYVPQSLVPWRLVEDRKESEVVHGVYDNREDAERQFRIEKQQ